MMTKDLVFTGLEHSNVPAWFGRWEATDEFPTPPPSYIVFTTMSYPAKYEDDVICEWRHYAYLEMWAIDAYAARVVSVISSMMEAGFSIVEQRDTYNESSGCNHISMTFTYSECVGDNDG